MNIFKNSSPSVIGEYFRERFFEGEYGCYYDFGLRADVVELPDKLVSMDIVNGLPLISSVDKPEHLAADKEWRYWHKNPAGNLDWDSDWTCAELNDPTLGQVFMKYFWDGDGTLCFQWYEGGTLKGIVNDDCKKDYNWKWLDDNQEPWETY